jgi:predicted neuraminidase
MQLPTPLLVLAVLAGLAVSAGAAAPTWRVVQNEFLEAAPPVPEVHASTLAEATDGTLVAAWFGGTKEGNDDVAIYVSQRRGSGPWSAGKIVADGQSNDGKRYPTWNPVLHRTVDGRLLLFFKTGPSPETWWGEVIVSKDHGATWTDRRRLPDGMLGPIKNKPIRLADGTLLCPTSVEYDAKRWVVRMEFTDETLSAWRTTGDVADPKKLGAIQPTILQHRDGRLQALCRSSVRVMAQTWSTDGGKTWSPLEPSEIFMPNSGIDALTLKDGSFLLVYNPSEKNADPKSWGERRPLLVAHSTDGRAWRTVATLDTLPNRHGYAYPAIIEAADGRIHITYTWNRARMKHVILAAP